MKYVQNRSREVVGRNKNMPAIETHAAVRGCCGTVCLLCLIRCSVSEGAKKEGGPTVSLFFFAIVFGLVASRREVNSGAAGYQKRN